MGVKRNDFDGSVMANNFTIASVIDKNKISSENVWLILLDITIRDGVGNFVETLRVVKNNENYIHKGNTYTAANFNISHDKNKNSESSFSISIQDVSGVIIRKLDLYEGGTTSSVTFKVVNTGDPSDNPEIEESYDVLSASANGFNVSFKLGMPNPLKSAFPVRKQRKNRCAWRYKGTKCGYTGGLATCDYTLDGANGCIAHNNTQRFGGFPGLVDRG